MQVTDCHYMIGDQESMNQRLECRLCRPAILLPGLPRALPQSATQAPHTTTATCSASLLWQWLFRVVLSLTVDQKNFTMFEVAFMMTQFPEHPENGDNNLRHSLIGS